MGTSVAKNIGLRYVLGQPVFIPKMARYEGLLAEQATADDPECEGWLSDFRGSRA
jgi:hypothetical protein